MRLTLNIIMDAIDLDKGMQKIVKFRVEKLTILKLLSPCVSASLGSTELNHSQAGRQENFGSNTEKHPRSQTGLHLKR